MVDDHVRFRFVFVTFSTDEDMSFKCAVMWLSKTWLWVLLMYDLQWPSNAWLSIYNQCMYGPKMYIGFIWHSNSNNYVTFKCMTFKCITFKCMLFKVWPLNGEKTLHIFFLLWWTSCQWIATNKLTWNNEWFTSNRISMLCVKDSGIARGQTLQVARKKCIA